MRHLFQSLKSKELHLELNGCIEKVKVLKIQQQKISSIIKKLVTNFFTTSDLK